MSVKALASQTVYYGISSIAAKFINYLLTPYLTYNALFSVSDNGKMSAVYSLIPMLNILFTYGMESAYFRFVNKSASPEETTNTTQITLLFTTVVFSVGMWVATPWLATVASLQAVPALISLSIVIIATDTLCAIPFARLRNEGRPLLFAFIRVSSILINIGAVLFFLSLCPPLVTKNPQGWASYFYNPATNPVVYILLANIVQNIVTLLLLQKWFWPTRWQINTSLLKNMLWYALPMLVAGLGGMVNETFDRLMLGWWLPSTVDHDVERGIYGACYKISLFVTLFIQAFRMGAEPFFFKQAKQANAPETYAKVTYYFVLLMALIFIAVVANMPILQYFVAPKYWRGLPIVPILLLANICLGIYYNLSVWYKVTQHVLYGTYITFIGCGITLLVNYIGIPIFGFMACAVATLSCYSIMMFLSYIWGQKKYPIPYATKTLGAYLLASIVLVVLLYTVQQRATVWVQLIAGWAVLFAFTGFLLWKERAEMKKLPLIGKFLG